jgi:uncharacterized membrane protein YjdF
MMVWAVKVILARLGIKPLKRSIWFVQVTVTMMVFAGGGLWRSTPSFAVAPVPPNGAIVQEPVGMRPAQ